MIMIARVWAAITVLAGVLGVGIELLLVIMGLSAVTEDVVPPLGIRLWRFTGFASAAWRLDRVLRARPAEVSSIRA
jgi:hypothetical protein